jgi:hypothetical protein
MLSCEQVTVFTWCCLRKKGVNRHFLVQISWRSAAEKKPVALLGATGWG